MQQQNNAKGSLFSSIFPKHEPPPPAQPAPQAVPRPAPPPAAPPSEEITRKLETLEKNLVGHLEKKLSEAAAAVPAPAAHTELMAKMEEMDARIREFHDKFLVSAAMLRNSEESKASARREIQDLLEAVREQQKYSEMDRQMHAQLEKAWARVEEMEKRLLDAYASAARGQGAPPPDLPAEMSRVVEETLKPRLKALESAMGELGKPPQCTSGCPAAALEHKDIKQELRGLAARGDESGAALEGVREELGAMSAMIKAGMDSLFEAQKRSDLRASEFITHAKSALLSEGNVELELKERIDALEARLLKANAASTGKAVEVLGLSASAYAAAGEASAEFNAAAARLNAAAGALAAFTEKMLAVNLEGIMGVSGRVLRDSLGDAAKLAERLRADAKAMSDKRDRLVDCARRLAPGQELRR